MRRDNNDGRPLHRTWTTLCMNKHLINKAFVKLVEHRKHPFPWVVTPKLPSAPILKQIPILASKSRRSTSLIFITAKALAIHHGREQREWLVENITWQLGDNLHRKPMGIAHGWEKRVIRTNITYAKRTVCIFSVCPQSRSLFSASFHTFCLTARAYLNTQKCELFCRLSCPSNKSPH